MLLDPAPLRSRVTELDLLRFLAALAVVFYHYTFRGNRVDGLLSLPYPVLAPYGEYGRLGVQLFFMISGFVILMTASSGSVRQFLISRFCRLYPAYWFCCTATFLATLCVPLGRYTPSVGVYMINMTMLAGFFGVPSIDGVYWSLFVELQFYFLVLLVLASGKIDRSQTLLCAWLVATLALDVFPDNIGRRLLIVDQAPFFIAGATCYLIHALGFSIARGIMLFVSWLVGMRHGAWFLRAMAESSHVAYSRNAVFAIVTAFFVALLLVACNRTGFFGRRTWLTLGALTYPLYLMHQYVGYVLMNEAYPTLNPHLVLWGTIAAMLLLAFLIHTQIENRFAPPLKRFLVAATSNFASRAVEDSPPGASPPAPPQGSRYHAATTLSRLNRNDRSSASATKAKIQHLESD